MSVVMAISFVFIYYQKTTKGFAVGPVRNLEFQGLRMGWTSVLVAYSKY